MNNDDTMYSMYASDDEHDDSVAGTNNTVAFNRKGMVNELITENDRLLIPDPRLHEQLMKAINDLQRKIAILEQNSRSQTSRIFQLERAVQKLKQELDKKISYE